MEASASFKHVRELLLDEPQSERQNESCAGIPQGGTFDPSRASEAVEAPEAGRMMIQMITFVYA